MHSIQTKNCRNLPVILALIYILCNYYFIHFTWWSDYTTTNHFLLFLAVQGKDKLLIRAAVLGIYIKPLHKGKHK